jgi:hypothetical protein
MPALAIVKLETKTRTTTELTGPDPDYEGGGTAPTVILRHAYTVTWRAPVVDIPGRWQGIELRPAADAMLVLIDGYSQAQVPNNDNVMPVPDDMASIVTNAQARRLQDFFGFSNQYRNDLPGRRVGEVLLFLMDVKPTPKNGRRILRLGDRVLEDEAVVG